MIFAGRGFLQHFEVCPKIEKYKTAAINMDEITLTEPQQRNLRVSLLSFEKTLRLADHLLKDGEEVGILYHRTQYLDLDKRRLAHEEIMKALQEIASLAKILGLEPEEENLSRIISSEMSVSWANLVDCHSDRMKGYGKVNPDTATKIDPAIDRLEKIAWELSNLMSSDSLKNNPTGLI